MPRPLALTGITAHTQKHFTSSDKRQTIYIYIYITTQQKNFQKALFDLTTIQVVPMFPEVSTIGASGTDDVNALMRCGVIRRRRQLKRRSQTTDPLYTASRSFDADDETPNHHQHVPDSVIYVPTCNTINDTTPSALCSYHRYYRSRTKSGCDAVWQTPLYTVEGPDAAPQTSFPLLVHPASTLATPRATRSTAMTPSPEVVGRPRTCFRSADNLDSTDVSAESARHNRWTWVAGGLSSEANNYCPCDQRPATVDQR